MNNMFEGISGLINGNNEEVSKENANMNSETPAGMMMKIASMGSKEYTINTLLSKESKELYESGILHIHDIDYYLTKSLNCLQHPLDKILNNVTKIGDCIVRPSKRIETASAITCISLQTIQNEMYGGQAIPAFDFYLAPFVKSTFNRELKTIQETIKLVDESYEPIEGEDIIVPEYVITELTGNRQERIIKQAINNTVRRVHQALESFVHNMNTMHSRGGNQVVFSSINYGTDTSSEGRCIIRELLNTTYKGVGNGDTPIFPIQIMKLKKGVNKDKNDPNYDLFLLACKVTARRFYPNFLNLDMSINYDERWDAKDPRRFEKEVATMGCRTRIYENICGEKTSIGRGNLSVSTLNLPGIALKVKLGDEATLLDRFFTLLDEYLDTTKDQLLQRYEFQKTAHLKNFPLLTSGMWLNSDGMSKDEKMASLVDQGTLSIGFIGLAEALIVLTGKHHGESEESQKLGLTIIERFNEKVQEYKDKYKLNFSVVATPAEGLSGRFVKMDRAKYGIIKDVTDKAYYTNSNHVPVWYKCSASHKAKIEGPYHKLTGAGHIFYVEMDGNLAHNPDSIRSLVKYMDKEDIGYMALNHTRNRCIDCSHEDSTKDLNICPKCGSTRIDTIQRITGYLVGTIDRWNAAKRAELNDRVLHDNTDCIDE